MNIGDRVIEKEGTRDVGTISRSHTNEPVRWWVQWDRTGREEWVDVDEIELLDLIGPTHVYTFNDMDNGSEHLVLKTTVHDIGTCDQFVAQELTLHSHARSSSFSFAFDLTPSRLRQLADQLEKFIPPVVRV